MRRKKKFAVVLTAALTAVFVVAPASALAETTTAPKRNYGTFQIQVDLGKEPPTVEPIIDPALAAEPQRFTLSDEVHFGTFQAQFKIRSPNAPVFDTFSVHNESSLPVVFGYFHEDQHIQPLNPARNMSELQACFNALCDTNVWIPAGTLVPPVPLGAIPPKTTATFKVGMKLAPHASRETWNGTGLTTTLYFQTLP